MPASSESKGLKPLTTKQEAFVRWYMSAECSQNATQAARLAGYKSKNAASLRVMAHKLLKNPSVKAAIQAKLDEATAGANVTIEKVLIDLERQRQAAEENGNFSAAIKASELQGKHLKMFTERIEHVETLDDVSDEQLVNLIREISQQVDAHIFAAIADNAALSGALSPPPGAKKPH